MNSTALGNHFRSHILELLRTKYKDATTETTVSWKNADIVFTMLNFGRRVRVAVECKFYSKKLTTSDFNKIQQDYQSAFNTQVIDTLIIISKNDIEAASKKLIDDNPRLIFMTSSQLEEWLVGLRPYIENLTSSFSNDDVSHYYINARMLNSGSYAFEELCDWVNNDNYNENGIAILGGYGLGKSSLAKRLAAHQAKKYLEDPENERMPILLRLGQVVHETELSGLFGKEFTSEYAIEGYSFPTLMHLNDAGRLLIILDGFDEMKHAMTESDFRSNFREFNKLRSKKSKVLLLGRPNAFTSESASLLIKGLGKMGGQTYSDSDFPAWRELNLDFFSKEESEEFLIKYLTFADSRSGTTQDDESIKSRVKEIIEDVDYDILQRPVQARIVGQLAASPGYSFKNINRFKLYNDFVEKMIGRDQEKRARRIIPSESRKQFLEDLAWWAWTRSDTAQGVFRKDEVPYTIFEKLPDGDAINISAKRSEYLVSSLTEHKDSDILYFAHRSFQEFLVSSFIAKQTSFENKSLQDLNIALTDDVISFLSEVENKDFIEKIYLSLETYNSDVELNTIVLLQKSPKILKNIIEGVITQVTIFDIAIAGLRFNDQPWKFENIDEWLAEVIKLSPMAAAEFSLYLLLCQVRKQPEKLSFVIAMAWERVLYGIDQHINTPVIIVDEKHFGGIGSILRDACKKEKSLNVPKINIDLDSAIATLSKRANRNGLNFFLEVTRDEKIANSCSIESISEHLSKDAKKQFLQIFKLKGDDFGLVVRRDKRTRVIPTN